MSDTKVRDAGVGHAKSSERVSVSMTKCDGLRKNYHHYKTPYSSIETIRHKILHFIEKDGEYHIGRVVACLYPPEKPAPETFYRWLTRAFAPDWNRFIIDERIALSVHLIINGYLKALDKHRFCPIQYYSDDEIEVCPVLEDQWYISMIPFLYIPADLHPQYYIEYVEKIQNADWNDLDNCDKEYLTARKEKNQSV